MAAVSKRHVLQQGPVIGALFGAARAAMKPRPSLAPNTPGPEFEATVPARPDGLIDDYIRFCGGQAAWYRGTVPAHLFPQWGFPLLARTLTDIPYDLRKVMNGGCRIEIHRPIPRGERLKLRACLVDIDDNGSRAVLQQRLITGTDSEPDAVTSTLYAIVPLRKADKDGKKERKEPKRVPVGAREIDRFKLGPKAGLDFAMLTGDFNPIHWIPPAARASGFKNVINHGFSTLGHAIESLNKNAWSGDVRWLRTIDCQFTKPLILPARPGVFLDGDQLAVGPSPGAAAWLLATVEAHSPYEG